MSIIDKVIYKFLGSKITFSQTGEDVILDHLFYNKGITQISYLDIGTNHPVYSSNTYLFYRKGNHGVCVEPNPSLCELIRSKRPKDLCLNIGVSAQAESSLDFYIMHPHTLSTFSRADAEALTKNPAYKIEAVKKIPLQSYNRILQNHFTAVPNLVSIDVEGLNEEIVESIDFTAGRPEVFCVETTEYTENASSKKNQNIIQKFTDNGYSVHADTYLNTIFVDAEKF